MTRIALTVDPGTSDETPPWIAEAIAKIAAQIAGTPTDLTPIPLDTTGLSDFARRVYTLARAIAPGTTTTYGALATLAGDPGASRAIGVAMGSNPFPIVVPCHRVLAADGLGGFSAPGGAKTKRALLIREGAKLQLPLFE